MKIAIHDSTASLLALCVRSTIKSSRLRSLLSHCSIKFIASNNSEVTLCIETHSVTVFKQIAKQQETIARSMGRTYSIDNLRLVLASPYWAIDIPLSHTDNRIDCGLEQSREFDHLS